MRLTNPTYHFAAEFAEVGRMTEPGEVKPRQRRTRQEVQRLVSEFGTSGLSRGEFCRIHAMTLSTLQRGLKRRGTEPSDIQSDGKRLVRVKVIGGSGFVNLNFDRRNLSPLEPTAPRLPRLCAPRLGQFSDQSSR